MKIYFGFYNLRCIFSIYIVEFKNLFSDKKYLMNTTILNVFFLKKIHLGLSKSIIFF